MLIPKVKFTFFSLILLSLFFSPFIPPSNADTVYLKNGSKLEGLIKSENADTIKLDISLGSVGIRKNDIERIERSSNEEAEAIRQKWSKEQKKRKELLEKEKLMAQEKKPESPDVTALQHPKDVDVSREKGHIFVEAVLNNKVKAQLLLDTGASIILLSNEIGRKLGIDTAKSKKRQLVELVMGDGRKVQARYVRLDTVSVQGVQAKRIDAAILLEGANEANFKDGLLGMSFLKKFNFEIDQSNNRLILKNKI